MSELLAPAGDYESFLAAISNGADAVYVGMPSFSARAYAHNFTPEELKEIIDTAHLREVKIYVAMNTIIFQNELEKAYALLDEIISYHVDGIIVQDLAIMKYLLEQHPEVEVHASTQTGIDSLEGVQFFEQLKIHRVVLARELSINQMKEIKKHSHLALEVFVHGALCLSYSGNCLMSGLIGLRSGNRGRCVGSCRKSYQLLDENEQVIDSGFLLSTKDLSTIHQIHELSFVDSLKIEGRMKEPNYIANVVSQYRAVLDKKQMPTLAEKQLSKTFNRTFTKGFLFQEDKRTLVNATRPNHVGYEVGFISNAEKRRYEITLTETVNQNDILRIEAKEDVIVPLTKIFDKEDNFIASSSTKIYLPLKEKLAVGAKVYKTKDFYFEQELVKSYPKYFKKIPIQMQVTGVFQSPLSLTIFYRDYIICVNSEVLLTKAERTPLSEETIINQLNKLNDTPYELQDIKIEIAENLFLPLREINELRRKGIQQLENKILNQPYTFIKKEIPIPHYSFTFTEQELAVYCTTMEQYHVAKAMGIKHLYYQNISLRNHDDTNVIGEEVLIGGYGGIIKYKEKTKVADYSFNVVNAEAVSLLFQQGVHRITLSHELNELQIQNLIQGFQAKHHSLPNLEMIVYGHVNLLNTQYCFLKGTNFCNRCRKGSYKLHDGIAEFPILFHQNCTNIILNGKRLNLIDDIIRLKNIPILRLQFTIENAEETAKIITQFQNQMKNPSPEKLFQSTTDTRGYFHREII